MVSGIGVAASAMWLVGLALFIAADGERARRFLEKFASSFRAHVFEQALRLVAGWAFLGYSSEMRYSTVFQAFGWALVLSAGVLLVLPWRLHQRFAALTVPALTRHMGLFGGAAFILGAAILFAMT